MASGRPDFHPTMLLEGKHDTQLIPVMVDEDGQMYIVMTGQEITVGNLPSDYFKAGENIGNANVVNIPSDYFKTGEDVGAVSSITANVDVAQVNSDRNMKGDDTGTKRFIAVDSAGVILARLKGAYGGVLKDISVDDVGILLTRMKGAYGGVLKDISVDDVGILLARMKGSYGGAMTDVAVDSGGAMMSRMKGIYAGGLTDVVVDSTGRIIAVMMGMEGSTPRNVAVDASGNMIALMKGIYGSTLKTIAVDTNGVMKANLSAQDLNWLTVRPAYGQARSVGPDNIACPHGATTTIFSAAGRGVTLGGWMFSTNTQDMTLCSLYVYADGAVIFQESFPDILTYRILDNDSMALKVRIWNTVLKNYMLEVARGLTFESSFEIKVGNTTGASITFRREVVYALVP